MLVVGRPYSSTKIGKCASRDPKYLMIVASAASYGFWNSSYVCTNGVVGGTGAQHANDGGLPPDSTTRGVVTAATRPHIASPRRALMCFYKQHHKFPDFVPPRHESDPRTPFKSTLHHTPHRHQTENISPSPNSKPSSSCTHTSSQEPKISPPET